MATKTDVVVSIGGDAKGLDAVTASASKTIGKFAGDTRKAFGGLGGQLFSLRGALSGLATGFSLKAVIDATVEAERIQTLLAAKLKSTGRQAEFTAKQLSDMGDALRAGTTFDDESLSQAQTTLLTFGKVTGKTFQDATASALDLSTALGMDLNAAAELVGRALQQPDKAAKQLRSANILLSKSQQELIVDLVKSGKTGEAQALILGKLETAYGGAAKAAGNTFGGALAELKNIAGDLIEGEGGSLDGATQAVKDLSQTLQSPEVKAGFASMTSGVITLIGWLAKLASGAASAAKATGEFFAELAVGSTKPFQNEIDELLAKIKNTESQLSGARFLHFPTEQYEKDLVRYRAELAKAQAAQADFLRMGKGKPAKPAAAPAGTPTGGAGGDTEEDDEDADGEKAAKKAAAAAKKLAEAIAAGHAAIFKAEADRSKAALEAQLAANKISLAQYHADKLKLETDAIDQEIAARQTAMATADAAEKQRLAGELEGLRIQRVAAVEASAREEAEAEKKLADEITGLQQRLLEATGRTAEARSAAIELEFNELIARLKANGDDAGVAIAIELKGAELARAQIQDIETQLSQAQDAYQRRQQEIDLAVQTGQLSRNQGRREQVQAAQELVKKETDLADAYERQATILGDPVLKQRVADLRNEIARTSVVTSEALNQIKAAADDSLTGLFEDVMDDPKNFADAVDNALGSIEQSMQRLIAQRLSEQLVDSLFGGLSGGASGSGGGGGGDLLGQLFSAGLSLFGGGMSSSGTYSSANIGHSGAVIGRPGPSKRVPAITFDDAPRYHAGTGAAGLGANEEPFIGLKGERVLNLQETRDYNNRTAPMSVNITIQASDMNSFRNSETEVAAQLGGAISRARRNR